MTSTSVAKTLVLGWGNNEYGQIGLSQRYTDDKEPIEVTPTLGKLNNEGQVKTLPLPKTGVFYKSLENIP